MVEKTTFTLAEAAQLLSCHKETLRRVIKSKKLKAAKIGNEYRISKADLANFYAARGGGVLFEDMPEPVLDPGFVEEEQAESVKEKKPTGPEQLKLPT